MRVRVPHAIHTAQRPFTLFSEIPTDPSNASYLHIHLCKASILTNKHNTQTKTLLLPSHQKAKSLTPSNILSYIPQMAN